MGFLSSWMYALGGREGWVVVCMLGEGGIWVVECLHGEEGWVVGSMRGGGGGRGLNLLTFTNPYLVCRNLFSLYNVRVRLSLSVQGLAFTSLGLNFLNKSVFILL